MDMNTIRGIMAVAALLGFLAIFWWAYRPSRAAELESIGRTIVTDNEGGN